VNKKQRRAKLETLASERRTLIFYEAPHKLIYTLKDLFAYLGDRKICIARELTKIHEEHIHTTLLEAIKRYEVTGIKGEIVLIVEGINTNKKDEIKNIDISETNIKELVKEYVKQGTDKKDAIKKVAKELGLAKNDVYKHCTNI
jgi:16S rRNA (cytidine1402-2'-O)-methyltransferase